MVVSDREALRLHELKKGKLSVEGKVVVKSKRDLSLVYTPGVAAVSRAIAKEKNSVYKYTIKQNAMAVVSDGSAVLGLGNIGPEAALPVMEGKCLLLKELANIDAFPICVDVHSADEIVAVTKAIAPVFGAVNLEDIAAPTCFEVETKLKAQLDIPVMHDDQHGTAVVVLAGLINSLKVVNKKKEDVVVVINGSGAAGIAIAKILTSFGVKDIIVLDTRGALRCNRSKMNEFKCEIADMTNKENVTGSLDDVIKKTDVFIGVSTGNVLTGSMVRSMNSKPIVMAMANPVPEIMVGEAKKAGAAVIATGRSDLPNQINNLLAFPGIFRGVLDTKATEINEEMKLAAADALARLVSRPTASKIVPNALDKKVVPAVAKAVSRTAVYTNAMRKIL